MHRLRFMGNGLVVDNRLGLHVRRAFLRMSAVEIGHGIRGFQGGRGRQFV